MHEDVLECLRPFSRGRGIYALNQPFLVKKHELSLHIDIPSLSHMNQSSLKAFHEQFKVNSKYKPTYAWELTFASSFKG